ncbi:MAG: aminodeoxychorismate synthase component I, partial [bacterium]
PLAWFGIFRSADEFRIPADSKVGAFRVGEWKPSVSAAQHADAVGRIKAYLKSGDTYQVNFTFRLRASFQGEPWGLFCRIQRNQRSRYASFIETDRFAICSVSPELFFSLDGDTLLSKPMKGTSKRGLTSALDRELKDRLQSSAKEVAENVMIVDMVRNDMGRVALPGTVVASHLFDVEQYQTVLQMVSAVSCETSSELPEIMRALFPCASVTGAPRIRTMQIIRDLEPDPRGIYTGCIGYVLPGRRAQFNVAIRTVLVDKQAGAAEYGVGGGIVWDSNPVREYQECAVKSDVLTAQRPQFDLLETMLLEKEGSYFLLEEHLRRLADSAMYFNFSFDLGAIRRRLAAKGAEMAGTLSKVRLLATENGEITITTAPLDTPDLVKPWRLALAKDPVDVESPYLYHKTTNRIVYDLARKSRPGYDDVLMRNSRDEVTESTIANVVIMKNGRGLTPPVSCGLLPGVFRNWLVDHGELTEEVLTVADIYEADSVFLINSVRKWIPAELVR